MTQDNRYVDGGEPVYTERVVETTYAAPTTVAPVYEAVEPVRRAHPGLIPLALSSLLGLLSLFLPFAGFHQAFTRHFADGRVEEIVANRLLSFWNIANGHHHFLLILLLASLVLGLIAYALKADWARYVAGLLGLLTGLWLLVQSLFRFSHAGLGNLFGTGLTGAAGLTSGFGRWLMALAGLALLATALWSLLRGAADRAADATVGTTTYNN